MGCLSPPKLSNQAHGPFGEPVSTRSPREGRQRHAAMCGRGLAGCSFSIVDGAVCVVDCGLPLKLSLCCPACCCCGNKAAVLWALGRVTAPHAHPQHAYVRTAQRDPVASIGTLRMTAIEYTEHTHTQRAAAAGSGISHEAVGVPFFVRAFNSLFVTCCCILNSYPVEFYFQFKTEMIGSGSRKQFQTQLCFSLVSSLWFSTQP